jgi:hypothetical protein
VFKIRQERKLWTISNKSLVAIKASLVIAALIGLVVFVASVSTIFAGGATIWTDKPDYQPGETAYISGLGFNSGSTVNIQITRPDSYVDVCPLNGRCGLLPISDASGSFSNYAYTLDGILGTYIVDASDGVNSAQTTFTDTSPSIYTIIVKQPTPGSNVTNPVDINGTWDVIRPQGQLDQYNVQVNWGDGIVNDAININRTDNGLGGSNQEFWGNFSTLNLTGCNASDGTDNCNAGTFSHNYGSSQLCQQTNVTVKLYHSTPPGTESSGDAVVRFNLIPGVLENCTNGIDDDCDGLVDCADPYCSGNPICPVCGNGNIETGEQCESPFNICCDNTTCQFKSSSTVCRLANGDCDVAEYCTGSNSSCPTDVVQPNGYVCAVESGQCDANDTCDGTNKYCNENYAQSGTPCNDNLYCNVGETCNDAGTCTDGSLRDCSANNISGIATCDNSPDNFSSTFDWRNAFTSTCDEEHDVCTTGDSTINHVCADSNNTDGVFVYNSVTQTCAAECDGAGIECQPKLNGDYCYYEGSCNTNPAVCACNYASNQYCPVPGTVTNGTCYYGSQTCTANGCGLLNASMGCKNYCNASTGPQDTLGPTTSNVNVTPHFNNGKFNTTATVNDTCSNIKTAKYYIGHSAVGSCSAASSEQSGTIYPLDNGTFNLDKLIEYVGRTSNYPRDGLNYICIEGQDTVNNWGNCACGYFEVDAIPPDCPSNIYLDSVSNPKEYLVCGNNAWLNSTVCDSQSHIQGGEYFLDITIPPVPAPWSGYWMNVLNEFTDGRGYRCAVIGALINTSSLTDGTHYINLRGKDSVENWGKMSECGQNISFIKDTKPPITNKTLIPADGKQHECEAGEEDGLPQGVQLTNGCNYVKTGTQIILSAEDQDTPDHEFADKVRMHWIIWYKVNPTDSWTPGQENVGGQEQNVTITLTQDSYHLIEYWAVDSCGWEETHHFELDIVDNKAPVTTKTVGDPKFAGNGFDWWITNHTLITLNCTDQTPHPVDHVTLYAKYKVDGGYWVNLTTTDGYTQFTFPEDSIHTLEWYCVDALGNTEATQTEVDKVDTTPPTTTKTYGLPRYPDDQYHPKWINSSTQITLTATDGGAICAVGVNKTYWRNTIVGNIYCEDNNECQMNAQGSGSWNEYLTPFTKPTESCHLIEYYSVDYLGNVEPVKKQCVYVENTSPVIDKTIDSPKHNCTQNEWLQYGSPDYGCWYITNHTKITLNCSDIQPHPVDNVKLYWRDYLIGQTPPSFTEDTDGYVEITKEDSEHVLEFYCEDALGNSNGMHKEIDIVDTKPPVSQKALGDPKHECNATEQSMYYTGMPDPTDGCYFINQSTSITITCQDQIPHPVDHVKIYYRDYLVNETAPTFTEVSDDHITIYKTQDSAHVLEWYCVDELNNTETTHVEYDIVDTVPPVTTKNIIGPQFYNATENKTYIDGVTQIELTCVDSQPHPVYHEKIYYRYRVDDGAWPTAFTEYTGKFSFPEESKHELEYYCVDALGNEEQHKFEIDYVDKTPPTTTKTYGTPFFSPNNNVTEWINSSTSITLTVDDTGVHKSGIKETKYRVSLVDDEYCLSQTACQNAVGSGTWNTYSTPFIIGSESCHLIEYYSVDNVNKTEVVKKQCVYVENTPPVTTKTVGDPKHACEVGENCDYYITSQTPITLECVDPVPHPVDQVKIYYRYYLDNETAPSFTQDGSKVTFYIPQDSRHIVEWYCVDALGNSNGTEQSPHSEIDVVDNKPPVSSKTFDGINIPCSELNCANSKDCDYYITQNTNITLSCLDQDPHPVDHQKVYYRYRVDDDSWTTWTEYTAPIQYNEDSKHTLEWYCNDSLGNKETTHTQIERVDTTAPETNKTVGDPKWGENDYWVTSNTPITLTSVDKEIPCISGSSKLYYTINRDSDCDGIIDTFGEEQSVNVDPQNCQLTVTFNFNEECLHEIRWHAVDALGNVETEHVQLHKVDNTPPHILILKPVDGWYSDGEDIPIVALAEDLTNPHGPCDPFSGMCNVGIENGRQCYAYLIDVLPHFQVRDLQTEGTLLYNNVSHECQGYATIPSPSGLPDGIAFLAVSADDNLGNMGNSLMEIFHTIAMECGCEEDNIYYCPQSCIVDVLQDIVTIWNLPKIGIDNNPIDVTITEPLDLTVLKGTPFNISANISDSANGKITSAITTGTPCYITLGGVSLGSVPYINEERKCSGTMVIPNSLPQGLLELKVEIADNAGNIGFGVINVIHDTIPPTDVTIWKDDEKKDLYYDQDGDYTLHWEAIDANLDYYKLFENGISIYNTTENNTLFVDKVDGTYEYYVIAHDMGGWTTKSNKIKVIVDSKNPDIEITGTVPGIGFFIATYTVNDSTPSSGIDRIEVTNTDGYALCSGTLPNGFCTVFLGSNLELKVYDKAGNSDTDSTSGTEKDITPPTIIYSSPSGVIAYNDPILEVRTNESSTCYYGINDNITEMAQMTSDGGKTTHTVNLGTLTDGLKVYHVICKDLAENYMDSSKTIVFYIDTTGNYELAIPDYGHYWSAGWNTFFLPKDMLDDICGVENGGPYNVTKVLSSLDGVNRSFDMVWYFDGEDWNFYDPQYPGMGLLTEFNDEQSLPYYIRMIREDRLEITQDICPV